MNTFETGILSCTQDDVNEYSFRFDNSVCEQCRGHCCRGQQGYVWVTIEQITSMAQSLGVDINQFSMQYIRRVGQRYSLLEQYVNDEYCCCFLDTDTGQCNIYQQRPAQCRNYPYWPKYKNEEQILQLIDQCPGVSVA